MADHTRSACSGRPSTVGLVGPEVCPWRGSWIARSRCASTAVIQSSCASSIVPIRPITTGPSWAEARVGCVQRSAGKPRLAPIEGLSEARRAVIPDLVVLGNLLVDDMVFPDGRTRIAEPGGATLYAALGASLWGLAAGVVSVRGDDYPLSALDALAARGVDLSGVRPLGRPGLRTWLLYEGARPQVIGTRGFRDRSRGFGAPASRRREVTTPRKGGRAARSGSRAGRPRRRAGRRGRAPGPR